MRVHFAHLHTQELSTVLWKFSIYFRSPGLPRAWMTFSGTNGMNPQNLKSLVRVHMCVSGFILLSPLSTLLFSLSAHFCCRGCPLCCWALPFFLPITIYCWLDLAGLCKCISHWKTSCALWHRLTDRACSDCPFFSMCDWLPLLRILKLGTALRDFSTRIFLTLPCNISKLVPSYRTFLICIESLECSQPLRN